MRIRWKNIYWPEGEWVHENGDKVTEKLGNFRATFNGAEILVIGVLRSGGGGHGEPRFEALMPMFLDAATLKEIDVDGGIIDVQLTPPVIEEFLTLANRLPEFIPTDNGAGKTQSRPTVRYSGFRRFTPEYLSENFENFSHILHNKTTK